MRTFVRMAGRKRKDETDQKTLVDLGSLGERLHGQAAALPQAVDVRTEARLCVSICVAHA